MEGLLPGRRSDPGKLAKDNRLFMDAVVWVARTGASKKRRIPAARPFDRRLKLQDSCGMRRSQKLGEVPAHAGPNLRCHAGRIDDLAGLIVNTAYKLLLSFVPSDPGHFLQRCHPTSLNAICLSTRKLNVSTQDVNDSTNPIF